MKDMRKLQSEFTCFTVNVHIHVEIAFARVYL